MNWLMDIAVIFAACLLAEFTYSVIERIWYRRLDIGCDYCEEAKKTYRTPDKSYWLCKNCMEVYLEEGDFSNEKKALVRNQYKGKELKS